ncbi:MAG: 23S rRNA (adenine(2503)-C(2))-methyltransferase RlmN [bacterium]
MNIKMLKKILVDEPKYRLKQAKSAIFQNLIENWNEALIFPKELREKLNENCPLDIQAEVSKTKDAVKARITLSDGLQIESVLLCHEGGRNTVCLSSQVGCALACEFCATGQMGFKRNLDEMEIIEQAIFFARYLKKEKARVSSIVFMGMGEPFLNYEEVLAAIRILNNKDALNIGARHISISTVGIIDGIKKLSKEDLQINLAISLHASNNEIRSRLMKINKKYKIEKVLEAVDNYIEKNGRKVMFEYLLIRGINDSDQCAVELSRLMKGRLYFLNLILYNPTGIFEPSSRERVQKFKEVLKREGVQFSERYRFGENINAACGQFIVKEKL